MKFVSHLDMNRYMPRLIKVSKIPAWYTEGFNQHLYITFALPLSLGITADYDCFDIKIYDDNYSDDMILNALRKHATEGIDILSVSAPWCKTTELSYASYTVVYKDSDDILLESLEKLFHSNYIPSEKKGKKGKVTLLNLAKKIKSIETKRENGILIVKVTLPAGNTETINPTLFLQSFCSMGKRRPEIVTINRDMLFDVKMNKFE